MFIYKYLLIYKYIYAYINTRLFLFLFFVRLQIRALHRFFYFSIFELLRSILHGNYIVIVHGQANRGLPYITSFFQLMVVFII